MGRGQVSMEYMLVIGFSLLMILPVIVIYGKERQGINDQVNMKQAQNIGRKIADAAETVYYLGKPAKTTLKVYMPNNVESLTVGNNTVLFKIRTTNTVPADIPSYCSVNITGTLSNKPGIQYVQVVAGDNVVNISTI